MKNVKFSHITDSETELAFVTVLVETDDAQIKLEFEHGGDNADGTDDYLINTVEIGSDCALNEYPQMLADILPKLKAYGLQNGMKFNC